MTNDVEDITTKVVIYISDVFTTSMEEDVNADCERKNKRYEDVDEDVVPIFQKKVMTDVSTSLCMLVRLPLTLSLYCTHKKVNIS